MIDFSQGWKRKSYFNIPYFENQDCNLPRNGKRVLAKIAKLSAEMGFKIYKLKINTAPPRRVTKGNLQALIKGIC